MIKYVLALALSLTWFAACAQHDDIKPTDEFTISGAVKHEMRFTIKDLLQFKQDTLGTVVIKNKQGKEKSEGKSMKGVLLKTLLDSAHVFTENHKEYNELCICLIASDNYRNVYSWNEMFNTDVGNYVYIITEMDGKPIDQMQQRILVMSLSDFNSDKRHMIALSRIEVKKMQ